MVVFNPGTQSVIANSTNNGLNFPSGVAVDGTGNIYIVDQTNNQVLKETLSGGIYTQSTVGSGLANPYYIAVDGAGNVYISDPGNSRILKETLSGSSYTQSTVVSGLGAIGVAVDGAGNVYIADFGNNRVLKETLSGGSYTQSVIVGSGLNYPYGVAVDGSGNVYIADSGNNRILKETLSGGSYTERTVGSGLSYPEGVAVDGSGNVYITDPGNSRVLKETLSGGSYTQSTVGNGLVSSENVAVDSSGNIYIADSQNARVLKVDVSDPPSLSFASTPVGATSSDSPQTVTLWNLGNAALTFPIPSSGYNPSIAANFTLNSSGATACPLIASSAGSPGTLALGTSCTLPISFTPTISGNLSGSLVRNRQQPGRNQRYPDHLAERHSGGAACARNANLLDPLRHVYLGADGLSLRRTQRCGHLLHHRRRNHADGQLDPVHQRRHYGIGHRDHPGRRRSPRLQQQRGRLGYLHDYGRVSTVRRRSR